MTFIEKIKEFKLLTTAISMVVVFTISGWTAYTDIYKKIDENNKQVELTQLTILKTQISMLEANPCKTSRESWADYNMLFSQYYTIKKKHNKLLVELSFKPMERLTSDSCKCYKGVIVKIIIKLILVMMLYVSLSADKISEVEMSYLNVPEVCSPLYDDYIFYNKKYKKS